MKPEEYGSLYEAFRSAPSRYDCGQHCAPHNGGEPVCCTTAHAVPIASVEEWKFLQSRTDLWRIFRARTAAERELKGDLPRDCRALECRGADWCERENRSLSCRTFPFFPYVTREREFVGLAYYWTFEDRCWVISNLEIVEADFVREFVATFDWLFGRMPGELDVFRDYSATMRRVFSRWGRTIPLIGRAGGYLAVLPGTGEIRAARAEDFPRHGPFARAAELAPSGR